MMKIINKSTETRKWLFTNILKQKDLFCVFTPNILGCSETFGFPEEGGYQLKRGVSSGGEIGL